MGKERMDNTCYLTFYKDRIVFWGSADDLRNCNIPSKYNNKKYWFEFPLFPHIVEHLRQAVPDLKVDKKLEFFINVKKERLEKFHQLKQEKDTEQLKEVGLVDTELFPHQRVGTKMLELFPKLLVFDEMGLGKTITAIRTALYRRKLGQCTRCLIISPNSIKRTVWANEIKKRTKLTCSVPSGTKKQREDEIKRFLEASKTRNENSFFIVVNFEMVQRFTDLLKQIADNQLLIIDECQRMKNLLSKTTKSIWKLNPYYLISMTGTPVDNKVEDLFSIAEYVSPNIFGGYFTSFRDKYCVLEDIWTKKGRAEGQGAIKRKRISGYKNFDDLKEKLSLISFRRLKKEVLNLPPKTYESRLISMTGEQKKCYDKIKQECYMLVCDKDQGEIEVIANGILSQLLRLSQVTDGYLTDFADNTHSYWIEKGGKLSELDQLVEDIVEYGKNKMIIWSRFKEVTTYLQKRYEKKYNAVFINGDVSEQQRAEIIDKFQNDNSTMIFVGQVQSCGVGMTLHRANYEVFYDKCFVSSSSIIQAEDRCHRIGMKDSLTIISLIAKDTVDEHWEKLLAYKLQDADDILDDSKFEQRITKDRILNLLLKP
ncbi:DEAD/DEAH box helicase [Candidatus Margulisiibacteriota bacterium]